LGVGDWDRRRGKFALLDQWEIAVGAIVSVLVYLARNLTRSIFEGNLKAI
jgi:hypothetical protein